MTKIIPVDPCQNPYAKNTSFKLIATQEFYFEGRKVQKLTYRNSHSLIRKIFEIAVVVLFSLTTFGVALCFFKGITRKEFLTRLKKSVVYQNVPIQPWDKGIILSKAKTIDTVVKTPSPKESLLPLPQALPSITKTETIQAQIPIVPLPFKAPLPKTAPTSTPIPQHVSPVEHPVPHVKTNALLHLQKGYILEENPEYVPVAHAWDKEGVALAEQVSRLEELRRYAFGTDKWVKYFGMVDEIPPLPDNIFHQLNCVDHLDNSKKIKDTHVLTLVPQAVIIAGKLILITLESLGEIVQNAKRGGHCTGYRTLLVAEQNNICLGKSHWALMKKELLPNSGDMFYEKQKKMVEEYSKKAGVEYHVPYAVDVATSSFMHFVDTGNRLFDSERPGGAMYTRCQEKAEGRFPLDVGGFYPEGFSAAFSDYDIDNDGIGAERILGDWEPAHLHKHTVLSSIESSVKKALSIFRITYGSPYD